MSHCHHVYLTLTAQESVNVFEPSSLVTVTVITASPSLCVVTLPSSSTVATFSFEDAHVTVYSSSAASGAMISVSVNAGAFLT